MLFIIGLAQLLLYKQPPRILPQAMQHLMFKRMPFPCAEVIARLMFVIRYLVDDHVLRDVDEVIENDQINDALQLVRDILTETRRHDILRVFNQTMEGNNRLLEEHEREIHRTLNEFRNDRHHASREWPEYCYRVTENNSPVRQEMGGHNGRNHGNILDGESAAQNNERFRDLGARSHDQHLPRPSAPRPGDPQTRRPQAGQIKSTSPVLNDRPPRFHQLPSQRPVLPEPLSPFRNPPPGQEPSQCCICEKNIQAMRTFDPLWSRIRDIIKELNVQQLQAFIIEINNYDSGILNSKNLSQEMIDFVIVPSLRRCHLSGRKCVMCLLNYLLQRTGRSDLANQVKRIQSWLQ